MTYMYDINYYASQSLDRALHTLIQSIKTTESWTKFMCVEFWNDV